MAQKIYTVTLQFIMDEKPKGKMICIDQYRGTVVNIVYDDETGKYKVDVLFNVTSLVGLMVVQEHCISKEVH